MVSIKLVLIIWLLCSLVSTILYIAFDNDTVTGLLAVGPVGWVLSIICFLVNKIHRFFKYHFKMPPKNTGWLHIRCVAAQSYL